MHHGRQNYVTKKIALWLNNYSKYRLFVSEQYYRTKYKS